jgi:hypothetical protein
VVEKKVISPSRAGMVRCLLKIAAASMQEQIKGNLLPPPPQLNNLTHLVITNVFWGSLGEHKQSVSQSVSQSLHPRNDEQQAVQSRHQELEPRATSTVRFCGKKSLTRQVQYCHTPPIGLMANTKASPSRYIGK